LRSGDGLVLDDGRIVEILSAPEALLEIKTGSVREFARIAWHLGNRHLPTQILDTKLRIRADHVIEAMLRGLGAAVTSIEAPFDPEGGAYVEPEPHIHTQDGHAHKHGDHPHHHD
jgi:urease accessory protein